ncbi:hypothetical protein H5410_028359 [Solanum commersonii]|uniref:Uncharacterized protein n=1 Tax=Solanum commersonii TaxID=4109 RepID=A0A9J5Z1P8_SOLCO|nr:hypothetical protein H5410_028359 [Solanum commersonii]
MCTTNNGSLVNSTQDLRRLTNNFASENELDHDGFGIVSKVLRGIIEVDVTAGLVPLFLCTTVGTTSTTTVDPLSQLGQLAEEFNIWLHVEAAYRGNACICPEFRQHLDRIERADSYGVANLQSYIRSDARMDKMFEGFVRSDSRFDVVVPPHFSLVCFRFNPNKEHELEYTEFLNKKLLKSVNSTG